jgi:hypothetical protein
MMTAAYQHYLEIVDSLRARRALPDWKPEDDRADLAQLLELFEDLSAEERLLANAEGHRSWP